MDLTAHRNSFHGNYCHLSVICWPNSYCSAETHGDQKIEDLVPRPNAQTASHTVSRHANDTSKASRHQPVDHPDTHNTPDGNQDNVGARKEIDDGLNNNDADEDEDEDTEANGPKHRRPRTANSNICPSQLRFYSGTWVDVLVAAKNNYRLFIHNEDSFPERTAASLEDARECLLDAIAMFREESKLALDEGS
jgi:hypothetical protein